MFTDLDHHMANMVCPYKYKIVWRGHPTNAFIIESNSSLTNNTSTAFFEYRVFHKVGRKDDDPLNYVINPQKSNENILSRIIHLNLDCFSSPTLSKNNTGEDTSILGFCNEYGLLYSRAYISYLLNTDFAFHAPRNSCQKYYLAHESMFLNDFIFNISKIRALLTAYSIYHKINQLDPSVTLTSKNIDLILCLKTLLILLLPNSQVFSFKDSTVLLERLWNTNYLEDFFYRKYNNYYLKFFDFHTWPQFITNPNYNNPLAPFFDTKETIQKLRMLYTSIRPIITEFKFNEDCSFSLIYPNGIRSKTDQKKYYDKIAASLEKHAKKLVEVLEHTALCVLNREMHDIKPYMYLNPNTPQKYHVGYQCFSLYDEIILEIASMYMRNTLLTKCARHDCDVLFIPSKHHDKKYCSTNCKDIVARRKYDERKRIKKAKSQ